MSRIRVGRGGTSRFAGAVLALFVAPFAFGSGGTFAQTPVATGPVASREDMDPDEPDAVVREIQALVTRAPDIMSAQGLSQEIARWQALSNTYPASRAAAERLARLQELRAEQTSDLAARRGAADAWLRAGTIALDEGVVRYTNEVSRSLVAIGDAARLDGFFGRCLDVARRGDRSASYLPLIDYADGLAALGRPEARQYYEQAYQLRVNEEALNKYVLYLLNHGDPAAALQLIESLSNDERRMNMFILPLWRSALQQLGRDTRPADAALEEMQRRFRGAVGGAVVRE